MLNKEYVLIDTHLYLRGLMMQSISENSSSDNKQATTVNKQFRHYFLSPCVLAKGAY